MWPSAIIEKSDSGPARPVPLGPRRTRANRPPHISPSARGAQQSHRAPEALNNHIVPPCAFAIHANRDLFAQQDAGEGDAGKLAALIRIKNLRGPEAHQRFLKRLDAEVGFQRNGQSPAEHPPTEPVHNGDQINEPARHRDVGYVGRPDLPCRAPLTKNH